MAAAVETNLRPLQLLHYPGPRAQPRIQKAAAVEQASLAAAGDLAAATALTPRRIPSLTSMATTRCLI